MVGEYIISLVVNDGKIDSLPKNVVITIATPVSGIISNNTTWDITNSPYLITSDVQVAYGVTLQIDAGVKVISTTPYQIVPYKNSIKIFGTLNVNGNMSNKVIFDGVNIVPMNDGNINDTFLININYSKLLNGNLYFPTSYAIYGSLVLRNSVMINMGYMYLWYPTSDCFIEKNIFVNSGGIVTGTSKANVYITNNAFYNSKGNGFSIFTIQNFASYGTTNTVVEYNSFLNTDRIALQLPSGYSNANIIATNNYWGTIDTSVIASMIYDKSVDLSSAGYITYTPFLNSAHQDTPDITPYLP